MAGKGGVDLARGKYNKKLLASTKFTCVTGPSFAAWLMICITGVIGVGVFFGCLVYGSRR